MKAPTLILLSALWTLLPASLSAQTMAQLPLSFEANRGQSPAEVKFTSHGPGYFVFLNENGAELTLGTGSPRAEVGIQLLHAASGPIVSGVEKQKGRTNYLFPNQPKRDVTNIENYARVRYSRVYRGIDMIYHGDPQRLEYDFNVLPGASPTQIELQFSGAKSVRIAADGELIISTAAGDLRQQKPVAYQELKNGRRNVDMAYVRQSGSSIGFRAGQYDKTQPLVIDPILTFSSFVGGTGFEDSGNGIAVDAYGYIYVAGDTDAASYPSPHQVQYCRPADDSDIQPCINALLAKLDPDGPDFVYKTYINVGDGGAHAVAVDVAGNAYLTGNTDSGQDAGTVSNAFLAKVDPTGSNVLSYGTIAVPLTTNKQPYHSTGDALAVDSGGSVYVTGNYDSSVFVVKVDASGTQVWGKALESSQWDEGLGIALDAAGFVYVGGTAGASDFPTTAGAYETACPANSTCGFVAKLDPQGNTIYSTLLPYGLISALAVNSSGNAYVSGYTYSQDFPVQNALQPAMGGCSGSGSCSTLEDGFVTEFNQTGSGLVFSTYLGGSGRDDGKGIALDADNDIYVTGESWSSDFPTANAIQPAVGSSGLSPFISVLNPDASGFIYSTYLGDGTGNAVTVDDYGAAYVTGTAGSDFPTVRAAQTTAGGTFVSRISSNSGGSVRMVQATAAEGNSVIAMGLAFPLNNSAGNMSLVFVRMSTTSQSVSVTDSAGNVYHDAVSQAQAADGHQIHLFYAANIHGGQNMVNVSFSGANAHPWVAIYEYSGLTANPLDQTAHAQGSDNSPFSGTVNTTASDELEFAATGLPSTSPASVTAGYGYSLVAQDGQSNGTSRAANAVAALNGSGSYAGRFSLSDNANWSAIVASFIVASPNIPPPTITTTTLANGVQGYGYHQQLTVTNGRLPFQWSITSGSLPAGLSLNAGTGTISGSPSNTGTSSFTVTVTDSIAETNSAVLNLTVNPNEPPPNVTTTSLPSGVQGQPYSATLQASGGVAPYTWALYSPQGDGQLPAGLTLDPNTGVISGTPTASGSSFYVQVTDADYHGGVSGELIINVYSSSFILAQSNSVGGSGVTSLSSTFSSPNGSGDSIIAFVRLSGTSSTLTVSDSNGNTYTGPVAETQTADGHQIHLLYASNIKGGSNTVTANFGTANNHPWLAIYEYSGTLQLDRTAAAQGSGTNVTTGATGTTASANELIFAGIGLPSSSTALISAGGGFTALRQNTSGSPGANESEAVTVAASYAGSFTLSAPEQWSALVATFAAGTPPPPPPSISRVQQASAEESNVSSAAVSFASANTAGDMLIAFVRMSTTSQTVGVSDSQGNVYSEAVSQIQNADGSQVHMFYSANIKAGANTVTASFSGVNAHPYFAVMEYSGVTRLDSTARGQGSNSSPNSGTTATASASNELVIGGLGLPASTTVTVTAGAGWTIENRGTQNSRAAVEDAITTNPGPFDATFSLSGAANWSSIVASFKP